MKRRHLYLFICTFSIMGCVEGLMEYKLSYDGDKIVIVGMLSDKGEGKILIRKSLHPQNPEGNDTLYNATVEMYENGNQYTSLVESGTGNFFLPEGVTLVPGNYYHLVANGGNLPRAETTPQLLYPPVCFDTAYFETRYAKYCFTDPADTTNYYTVMMREFFLGEDITDYEHRMEFINPYGLFTDAKYNEDICYY
ncbi:MAG: DUF4249 domain-containing protein, partial [Cyclobacteriaceae bacterium]|nr:DUF4249 domain-containing protein [Cyclobacteriaceae bacterium]